MSELNMTELYFEWWLDELKKVGLVLHYQREPKTFVLHNAQPVFYHQYYKRKDPLIKSFNLFQPITYTPDYRVIFDCRMTDKLIGLVQNGELLDEVRGEVPGNVFQQVLFYSDISIDKGKIEFSSINQVEVYFDVKPPSSALRYSGRLGSSREFPIKQRLMFEEHGIIVNKVVPVGAKTALFQKTFMPKRYKFTDKSGAVRKLKGYEKKCDNLEQYLASKEISI